MNIPVSINEDDLFKYDPTNLYYNDICYSYSTEDGTDIILSDRKNEFNYNNMSLCESNCTYKGYNAETKTATCQCEAKTKASLLDDIINNKDVLVKKFFYIENIYLFLYY